MNVTIVSVQAILHGRTPIVWMGEIEPKDLAEVCGGSPEDHTPGLRPDLDLCESFFRYFNRVDESDLDRLAEIGYTQPSLSVGDLIAWDHVTYRVAGSGFEKLTESSDYAMALTRYTLLSMDPDRAKVD